ncbi:hypothetical protein F4703DRAFT_1798369 [Phycomyces blakesleeanus]
MNYILQTSFKILQKNVYISSGVSGAMLVSLAISWGWCQEDGINVIDVIILITGRTPGLPSRFYLSTKVKSSLTELLYLFEDIKQQLNTKIFSIILDLTDYREYLHKEFAESFVSHSSDQDLINGFLEAVTLSPKQLEPNEKVTISTLHNSKGLEWPCVFVAACEGGSSHIQESTHICGNDPGQA